MTPAERAAYRRQLMNTNEFYVDIGGNTSDFYMDCNNSTASFTYHTTVCND